MPYPAVASTPAGVNGATHGERVHARMELAAAASDGRCPLDAPVVAARAAAPSRYILAPLISPPASLNVHFVGELLLGGDTRSGGSVCPAGVDVPPAGDECAGDGADRAQRQWAVAPCGGPSGQISCHAFGGAQQPEAARLLPAIASGGQGGAVCGSAEWLHLAWALVTKRQRFDPARHPLLAPEKA